MRRIFGGKKQPGPPAPTLDEANQSMERRVQILRQKISECDKDLADLKEGIKKSRGASQTMNKQRAVQVLKRKRMYESQLQNLTSQQFNVEQMQFTSQGVQDTIVAVSAMKAAHEVQKKQMKQLNVEQVENMMDDMQDLMMDTEEINEAMSRNYALDGIDETELDAELAELDEDILQEDISAGALKAPSYLPSAPPQKTDEITY
ncbi:unnamed protein product [Blepharisma stoltei]|uniref:Charged multivesicular body protein 5 n=1 Tax=Blepharisma stoltei TaxID=1481888 RepID=A0AAU9K311_9CILI|nr:unnamed protein product [Blepharisma stoltei]